MQVAAICSLLRARITVVSGKKAFSYCTLRLFLSMVYFYHNTLSICSFSSLLGEIFLIHDKYHQAHRIMSACLPRFSPPDSPPLRHASAFCHRQRHSRVCALYIISRQIIYSPAYRPPICDLASTPSKAMVFPRAHILMLLQSM